jgi:hypothetical protein
MNNPVDAGDHTLDCRHIGEFAAVDFLAFAGRRQCDTIGKAQRRIDASQGLAQAAANTAPRPRNQHSFHAVSLR